MRSQERGHLATSRRTAAITPSDSRPCSGLAQQHLVRGLDPDVRAVAARRVAAIPARGAAKLLTVDHRVAASALRALEVEQTLTATTASVLLLAVALGGLLDASLAPTPER